MITGCDSVVLIMLVCSTVVLDYTYSTMTSKHLKNNYIKFIRVVQDNAKTRQIEWEFFFEIGFVFSLKDYKKVSSFYMSVAQN